MRRYLLLLLLLLILPTQGWAAVAVDSRAQGTGTTTSPQTTSFTVNSASPLIVSVSWQGAQTLSGVTWNGTAMSLIGQQDDSIGIAKTGVYGLANPATGTHDVVVTWSANPDTANSFMISTTGGDTSTGWRTAYKRSDTDGTGPGITVVDSQNGDIVFHAATMFANPMTFDGGEDVTSTQDDSIVGGTTSGGLSTKAATGASTVVGATDVTFYSEVGVSVFATASAAPRNLMLMGVGQ